MLGEPRDGATQPFLAFAALFVAEASDQSTARIRAGEPVPPRAGDAIDRGLYERVADT